MNTTNTKNLKKINRLILKRSSKSRYMVMFVVAFFCLCMITISYVYLLYKRITVDITFYNTITIAISYIPFINYAFMENYYRNNVHIRLYSIIIFPVRSKEIFSFFLRILFFNARIILYICFLSVLTIVMIISKISFALLIPFIAVIILYFVMNESYFIALSMARAALPQKTDDKMGMVLFYPFIIYMIAMTKIQPMNMPVLNIPVQFLIAIIHNNIMLAIMYAGVIIILSAAGYLLANTLLKRIV